MIGMRNCSPAGSFHVTICKIGRINEHKSELTLQIPCAQSEFYAMIWVVADA